MAVNDDRSVKVVLPCIRAEVDLCSMIKIHICSYISNSKIKKKIKKKNQSLVSVSPPFFFQRTFQISFFVFLVDLFWISPPFAFPWLEMPICKMFCAKEPQRNKTSSRIQYSSQSESLHSGNTRSAHFHACSMKYLFPVFELSQYVRQALQRT